MTIFTTTLRAPVAALLLLSAMSGCAVKPADIDRMSDESVARMAVEASHRECTELVDFIAGKTLETAGVYRTNMNVEAGQGAARPLMFVPVAGMVAAGGASLAQAAKSDTRATVTERRINQDELNSRLVDGRCGYRRLAQDVEQ